MWRYRFPLFLLMVSQLGLLSARAADSWPAFRGPDRNGIVDSRHQLPKEWSSTKNIVWRTELPGSGLSSPVIGGGRIYLTTAIPKDADGKDPQDYSLSMLVVDATSGDLLKTIHVMDQTAESVRRIHNKNSHTSPTAILDGERIFVHFGYQGTACLSLDGDVIWENRELYFNPTHGNGGTPILVDNKLIFTCDGGKEPKIVALDADTGSLVWQTPRPVSAKKTFSFCTPTLIEVQGHKQVIAPGSDCVLALDPATGRTIWDVRYTGYSVIPKPIYHRGLVFIATSFDSSKMLAIRPTGSGVVTDSHVVWQLDRNAPKTPSLVASDGLVYSVSDDGIALCVEAESGEIVYRQRLGGSFSASPMMAAGHIYFTSEQGVTTVVRAGRKFEQVAENDLGERSLASLAVVDDALILRTDDALYRIEE
jgi:outer membrane protein assembly factor BamB